MKLKSVNHIPRTKMLDTAIASIQTRMNHFKNNHQELFYKPDYDTDFFLAGKKWKMIKSEESTYIEFDAGQYKIDTEKNRSFVVHFDTINNKIKDIYIVETS